MAQGASANADKPAPSRLERENMVRSLVKVCVPAQPVRYKEKSHLGDFSHLNWPVSGWRVVWRRGDRCGGSTGWIDLKGRLFLFPV